ncbi:MAG: hypothetical protein IKS48_11550 [Eubacterium sp.]|nr:hypothetical protein [Clostridiales bacterium]MBR6404009.1 hypothetical protein [Eubacterium sp.]
MIVLKKFIASLVAVMTMCAIMVPTVSASTVQNRALSSTSTSGYFSAGSSTFLPGTSTVTSYDGKYYVYLSSYQFDSMPANARPYNAYIMLQAYTTNHMAAAGQAASFSVTGCGYDYYYNSGYGGVGQTYCLKAWSTYTSLGASVSVVWEA